MKCSSGAIGVTAVWRGQLIWQRWRAAAIRALEISIGFIDWMVLPPPCANQAGICLIRVDAIGDFILWLDAAAQFKRSHPQTAITLITSSVNAALARQLPYWDEVWPIDTRRLAYDLPYRWHALKEVRARGFLKAVQPTYSRQMSTGDALVRATGASERIGSAGDRSNSSWFQKRIADRWYTRLVETANSSMMELVRNAEFSEALSLGAGAPRVANLPAVAMLPENLSIGRPYFVVFPGASWIGKQWPVARFARLIETVNSNTGWTPVLCGSAPERELCDSLAGLVQIGIVNLAGLTSLPEFCEVVRRAELLVANDTSAVHIAAATGTPSVGILGGGHFGRFLPYPDQVSRHRRPEAVFHPMPCFGCNWRCTLPHPRGGPVPCVSSISLAAVLAAVDEVTTSGNS